MSVLTSLAAASLPGFILASVGPVAIGAVAVAGLAIVFGVVMMLQAKQAKARLARIESSLNETRVTAAETQERAALKEQEAEEAIRGANEANAAKSTFLATMSHELRTPLNCILGLSEVLMATDPNKEQKEYLDSIRSSVNALLAIIGNVLDYSKIEAGHLELRPESFSLGELIEEIEKLFSVNAREKDLEFKARMEPETPIYITADRNYVRQVLVNLIGNAIKFTERGTVELVISREKIPMEESPQPGKMFYNVTLEVRDSGIGIAEEQTSELFQPFHQLVGSRTRKYEGTGLGLAICKRIVDAMGGKIGFRPNKPEGTVFFVELMLQGFTVKKAKEKKRELTGSYKHALGTSFYSHHILVADDNQANCKVMKAMMEKMGHSAEFVNNGLDAIRYLQNHDVDLVFMDIMMPFVDGVEATQRIRAGEAGEHNKGVPIVALTAFALTSDREKFLSAGMDFYLTKPVQPEFMRAVLTNLARQKVENQVKVDT